MFDLVHIERTTAFFIRTDAPAFYQFGDGWEYQAFNKARFPAYPPSPARPIPAQQTSQSVEELQARVRQLERDLTKWKAVAEQRRLKRRLARRIGDWPFLR